MAYANAVNMGRPIPGNVPSFQNWARLLNEKKHDLERVSGIRLVPPLVGIEPFLNTPNQELVEFAELFVYNMPMAVKCTSANALFPLWSQFMTRYVRYQWPEESVNYLKWLTSTRQEIGAIRPELTALDDFLIKVTFPGTVFALSLPVFYFGNQIQAMCEIKSIDNENGFECIGNILWEKDFIGLRWILEDPFSYQSIGRRE